MADDILQITSGILHGVMAHKISCFFSLYQFTAQYTIYTGSVFMIMGIFLGNGSSIFNKIN